MTYTTIYNDPLSRDKVLHPWIYWDNAFTDEEIDEIVAYCDNKELMSGTVVGPDSEETVEEGRVSKVAFHGRNPDTAWIFDRLNFTIQSANEQFFNYHLNGYDAFQYTTYSDTDKGHYTWHMDTHFGKPAGSLKFDEPRKLSLTLMLNDDYEGGEFQFNFSNESDAVIPVKKKGRILMFPSFMLHRVAPVTKGIRRSIVIWVVGPKFV
jgi:PKHD-type hydroxylase